MVQWYIHLHHVSILPVFASAVVLTCVDKKMKRRHSTKVSLPFFCIIYIHVIDNMYDTYMLDYHAMVYTYM